MGIFSGLTRKNKSPAPWPSTGRLIPTTPQVYQPYVKSGPSPADQEVRPDPKALWAISQSPEYQARAKKKARRDFLKTVVTEIGKNLAAPVRMFANIPTRAKRWVPTGQRGETDVNVQGERAPRNPNYAPPVEMPEPEPENLVPNPFKRFRNRTNIKKI